MFCSTGFDPRPRWLSVLILTSAVAGCSVRTAPASLTYDSGVTMADADTTPDATPRDLGVLDALPTDLAPADMGVVVTTTITYDEHVAPILASRCSMCHGMEPLFGAPMPLATYAQVTAQRYTTVRTREAVSMPEYLAGIVSGAIVVGGFGPMPPRQSPALTATELSLIQRWAMGGYPRGATDGDGGVGDAAPDGGAAPPDSGSPLPWRVDAGVPEDAGEPGFWVDMIAHPEGADRTTPFPLPVGGTSYICWSYLPAITTDHFITVLEPYIDNRRNTHHALVYLDRRRADTTTPIIGPEECEGIPAGTENIGGWFPGRGRDPVPPGTGIRIRPGERIVFQMHYDSVTDATRTDNSGTRAFLSPDPSLVDTGVLWSGPIWGTPIRGSRVEMTSTCDLSTMERPSIQVWAAVPHMHTAGREIYFEISRAGSMEWTPVEAVPQYDFNSQAIYRYTPEVVINRGDRIRTRCIYDTGARAVAAGEASEEEMCFTFVFHYPLLQRPDTRCITRLP